MASSYNLKLFSLQIFILEAKMSVLVKNIVLKIYKNHLDILSGRQNLDSAI